MVVFTKATVLVPHASVIEAGLGATVLSFTVMTYTTALTMGNVWDQMFASVHQDLL